MIRLLLILYCFFTVPLARAQLTRDSVQARTVTQQRSDSAQAVANAIAELKQKNNTYWKAIKLVMLVALVAALLLMQVKYSKRR
jgi:Na+/glutamate symporter